MNGVPAGIPQVPGQGVPEGFTRNYVMVFKSYFCKFACTKNWDNFYAENVLLNDELRTNTKAMFNELTEEEFHNSLYDSDEDYARLVEYVLEELVHQNLFTKEKGEGVDPAFVKTRKLKELCPKIVSVAIPSIDPLSEDYDRRTPPK